MPSQPTERILVRGVNWLGDAVMTTPALQRLREARPDAHITLLTHGKLKDLYRNHPAINEVHTFVAKSGPLRIGWRLRKAKYDLGLIFPNSPRSALEMWFGGVKKRVGYARPWRDWLLTQAVQPRPDELAMHKRSEAEIQELIRTNPGTSKHYPPTAHHIHQYLHLTAAMGAKSEPVAPKIVVPDESVTKLIAKFNLTQPGETPLWFGLNAGAEYGPAKRWPEERFTEAAIEIQRRTKCRWLVFGVAADLESSVRIATNIYRANEHLFGADEVEKFPHVRSLVARTTLGELCAALKFCRVLLTNDSGPMHVAAALGTPVVVPFGSTSPELTGPGLPGVDSHHQILRAHAPCSPCFLRQCPIDFRCMNGISVTSVIDAVLTAAR
jgi:lipopolysaccharide heptosyltransferase II